MPHLRLSLFIFLLIAMAGALSAAEDRLDENYYPFAAKLIDQARAERVDGADEETMLARETPFVLIRVEGDDAIIDVSRRGVFRVSVASTDIVDLTHAAMGADTDGRPEMSRMAAFIGNKLVNAESGWQDRLPMPEALKYRTWIFLYADTAAADTADAVRVADEFYAGLDADARATTTLVFMEINGAKDGIRAVAETHRPRFQAMAAYLSIGYTRSFAHLDAARTVPAFVAVNAAGTILARHVGADVTEEFWAKCRP